jgi:hypothetical protein
MNMADDDQVDSSDSDEGTKKAPKTVDAKTKDSYDEVAMTSLDVSIE